MLKDVLAVIVPHVDSTREFRIETATLLRKGTCARYDRSYAQEHWSSRWPVQGARWRRSRWSHSSVGSGTSGHPLDLGLWPMARLKTARPPTATRRPAKRLWRRLPEAG